MEKNKAIVLVRVVTLTAMLLALGGLSWFLNRKRPTPSTRVQRPALAVAPPQAAAPQTPPGPLLLITQRATLDALEEIGLEFGRLLVGERTRSNAELMASSLYRSLVDELERDLWGDRQRDTFAGTTMRHRHRQLDARWLSSNDARFELVGVANRTDREPFVFGALDSVQAERICGETRLIYRLAYRKVVAGRELVSRLPMTVSVVFWQRASAPASPEWSRANACGEIARQWFAPAELKGQKLALWLREPGRPLSDDVIGLANRSQSLKSVEVNVQSVRWPSTMRPDLGGHAEYILRVLHLGDDGVQLVPTTLENTPDVFALKAQAASRAELLDWLKQPEQLRELDQGTLVTPARFLARRAISVTPHGRARLANTPWSELFVPSDFAALDLSAYKSIGSPRALLRRLDGLSCQGCHQTRSLAGFHLLGEDAPRALSDALASPSSPHLEGDLPRRMQYMQAVARAKTPDDYRPHADSELARGAWGTHCGLGDVGFATWTCNPGLKCTRLEDDSVGTCLEEASPGVGGPCAIGRVTQHSDPHRDAIAAPTALTCTNGGVCDEPAVGFPHGMCVTSCDRAGEHEACGFIPILRGFNDCLARGGPFFDCVKDHHTQAALRACDSWHPCRDDYVCTRLSMTAAVCMPPYFLLQLRVDGHPQ